MGVDGRISELVPVVSGVPQGPVLGPVLFLIHMSSSSSSYWYPLILCPADATQIWRSVKTFSHCMGGLKKRKRKNYREGQFQKFLLIIILS